MTTPPLPSLFRSQRAPDDGALGDRPRPGTSRLVDALMLCVVAAAAYGVLRAAAEWRAPVQRGSSMDLSVRLLPWYAGLSTLRMAIAYVLSLAFSIAYARVAAASRTAERFMLPLLDILQSIPILSFMPGVVIGLAALFPGRNTGLELAAIILIFTSQAWNLAFSFHQSLITIPRELTEAATVYRLGFWRRLTRLELPSGAISLIANSMMSWAGGWFFLMASEQFTLPNANLRIPGLGSYLADAADQGNMHALALGVVTLVVVIVLLDQVLWRPLVAWSDRFKIEQSSAADAPQSAVLDALQRSALVDWARTAVFRPAVAWMDRTFSPKPRPEGTVGDASALVPSETRPSARVIRWIALASALVFVGWGVVAILREVATLTAHQWGVIALSAGATLLRTTISLVLAAAWTVPVGVWIGTNPKRAQRLQPLVQITASVPATALFPVLLLGLLRLPSGLNVAAVALMLLGTQWYVLFNVIAGAMAIPSDLEEAAVIYHVSGWRRWKTLILPAIFPYLVTGMITATGGAWNASIISERVTFAGHTVSTVGLGALIAEAVDTGQFNLLLAGTLMMSAIVITGNRLVWRRLYALAESRYRLE